MKLKAYPFQRDDAAAIEDFGGRALLANDMGLGKTIIALLWARMHPEARPIVVVCPAILKHNNQWRREIRNWLDIPTESMQGNKVPGKNELSTSQIMIINYEILESWLPWLIKHDPQLIILDEVQYCKTSTSQRTKNVRELCMRAPYVIGLSGTPIENRPSELWPILNIIRPDLYPEFMPYAMKFCNPKRVNGRWDVSGATNLKQLHNRLRRTLMVRRTKKETLTDLADKVRTVIPITIRDREEYDDARDNFIKWLHKRHGSAKVRTALKAQAVIKIGYLKRLAAKLKFRSVIKWIKNHMEENEGKALIFAHHKKAIEALRKHFPDSVCIAGGISRKERLYAEESFQNNKRTRIFIGGLRAAGIGLNLTSASSVMFAELGWTPGEHVQAEDRAHRIGQTKEVHCYYFVARDTIEERICEILQDKQQILDSVLDGKEANYDLNLLDILIEELLARKSFKL